MVRSSRKSNLIGLSAAAIVLACPGLSPSISSGYAQTPLDVLQVFKEAVKQSKDRQREVAPEKRGDARVKRLQAALSELGYYKGEADGIYGPNTDQALEGFLRDRNLEGPRAGEINALGRMVELTEAQLAKKAPDSGEGNWISAYAEGRGGCSYFDQVLFGARAPDGTKYTGDGSSLFGKPVISWTEPDLKLLEQAYFAACGARSGDMDFERDQFQSSTIANLRARVEQENQAIAEAAQRKLQEEEKRAADAAAIQLLDKKLPEIESGISACEGKLVPDCSRVAEQALATLNQLTESARSLKESGDYPNRVYRLESRALDIRAQSYEASKSQDARTNLVNNCGEEIAGRKLSDPIFDQPILWFEPNFTVRHYLCFFRGNGVVSDLGQYGDGSLTFRIKDIRLEFDPLEVSVDTSRYGAKKPVREGGILAPVRIQNGLQSSPIENAEVGIRLMGELVQRYATIQ